MAKSRETANELAAALRSCRGAFVGTAILSGLINILMLTGSFYMLEVYDRVLPSRSVPTLLALTILAAVLFAFLEVLDFIRACIVVLIGTLLDETLSGRVFDTLLRLPLTATSYAADAQPLRDLDTVRSFLTTPGPTALFDLPWVPIYVAICFIFHPLIGAAALCGAMFLIGITLLTEKLTRAPLMATTALGMARNGLAERSRRNAEVLTAMGMATRMGLRWRDMNTAYVGRLRRLAFIAGSFGAIARSFRLMLQSAVLGLGAYLVIKQEATAGIIIAASILTARALAPIDLAIAHWRGFVAARQSWARLGTILMLAPARKNPMPLMRPSKNLVIEHASVAPPGESRVVLQDAHFTLNSGDGLGIIGPSASGKSSLARMIVGIGPPVRGHIRLDHASLDQWDPEVLGQGIGYLPQDVELLAGSVAENIARFEVNPDPTAIIAAAQAAGVHELIVGLCDGYETQVGEQGAALSTGQQQRIALARALYRDPFLVVLDEPNSNLDAEGEAALSMAIRGVRGRGGIALVVAHQSSALASIDLVLLLRDGRQQIFGPKDEILRALGRQDVPAPPPLQAIRAR